MEQVNQFKQAWLGHAYTYTKEYRTIYAGQLVSLLRELSPPLGVGAEGSFYDCQLLAKKVLFSKRIELHPRRVPVFSKINERLEFV